MSADFLLILLAGAGSALGTWATLRGGPFRWLALPAVVLWTVTGIQTALLAALSGDGRIVPGFQINPLVKDEWGQILASGSLPTPEPAYCLLALLAHLFAILARPTAASLRMPLAGTLLFVALFFVLRERVDGPATTYVRALGPSAQAAFLTLAPGRLLLSSGPEEAAFLDVRVVQRCEGDAPEPRLQWTNDGKGIVLTSRYREIFAIDADGRTVGGIPEHADRWPHKDPRSESTAVRRALTQAERAVAEFIKQRGGLHVR